LALARLEGINVIDEVVNMISKLEKNDPMRKGRYQEWRRAISGN